MKWDEVTFREMTFCVERWSTHGEERVRQLVKACLQPPSNAIQCHSPFGQENQEQDLSDFAPHKHKHT
jgi:3-methyladenine DNA glycosylase AlkC